ncbi:MULTISPECIES: hypothetical protein [Methylophaga]|uniref:Uncharacterized protein n=1 Tax=Methylophaga aminisulfidivorans MP TaxID=1026882 RepID=F5T1M1_9GAMM|nr:MULTISPECIES: hypothetical protein [Methylophaga]EGL53115.1 hypothetical protein MAMP_00358 [Methylophaga aminisulfidivorans MP]WVI84557.1 hypothetical protein VSX76_12345 [Methylophaga thalassica]
MKKAMLFVVALLFSVGVNAATLSLETVTSTPGVTQKVSTVFNNGSLVIANGAVEELKQDTWKSEFNLTSDDSTGIRVEWTFNPSNNFESATLRLAKLAANGYDYEYENLYNITGSFVFSAFITAGVYAIDIFGANSGRLEYSLSVSAVPVPAALFLFAPALLGFLGLRRKTAVAA